MTTDQPTDSHESASMARPVSSAEVDGWEVESSSAIQPSNKDLAERLSTEPTQATPDETDDEIPTPVSEDHDDSLTDDEKPTPAAKRKLTAAERKAVLQAEFNALTKQREDAKRAFAAEEAERQRERARAPKSDTRPLEHTPAPTSTETAGRPDWDEYESRGETFAKYQADYSKWLKEEITREVETKARKVSEDRIAEERERATEEKVIARHEVRLEAAKQKYADFEEVVNENLGDVEQTPFMRAVVIHHPQGLDFLYYLGQHPAEAKILATLPMTRPIMDAVKQSSDPSQLLSYFANNTAEHDRIARLDPALALLALGRLSAELSLDGAKTGSPRVTVPVTTAKPPIRPLGGTRSAGVSRDVDDLEFGPEYVRRENEARLARLGRH